MPPMPPELELLINSTADFLGWLLVPFALFITVEWLVRLFRFND